MEAQNFGYSTKNIPIGTAKQYKIRLMEKIESFAKRIRWKAFYAEGGKDKPGPPETYGFKTGGAAPSNENLLNFEEDLFNMVNTVKFRKVKCPFQETLQNDIDKIKESDRVLVSADKTTNFYSLSKDEYNKLLTENITKTYKKTNALTVRKINREAQTIATKLELADRIQVMAEKPAFITLKDHKDNFASHPKCRLLNPAKSEIGRVSKRILERIIKEVKTAVHLPQMEKHC